MNTSDFLILVEQLTGSPTKGIRAEDSEYLLEALSADSRQIDVSQFNEVLLIANKDRVTPAFFKFFFCRDDADVCRIGDLPEGVRNFQKMAMLRFGNFIYAYRQLSKANGIEQIRAQLGRYGKAPKDIKRQFLERRPAVLDIKPISRDETYLVGYISASEIVADKKRPRVLQSIIEGNSGLDWEGLSSAVVREVKDRREASAIGHVASALRVRSGSRTPAEVIPVIEGGQRDLDAIEARLHEVRKWGARNTDVYLTWDHMDVYFATSMRKRWEYEDLHDFVNDLMSQEKLRELNIRYFDPTQSYDPDRISKGLIESLMLKRAICTVYSVQDTDTLGKDSELAATLAQGKPVIAYAPRIEIDKRVSQLRTQRPSVLRERLQFVLYAGDGFQGATEDDEEFVEAFLNKIDECEAAMPWRSLVDSERLGQFQTENAADIVRFCTLLAEAEARIYDKRAGTLRDTHPLGIQVNLDTGVANGVLVVRDVGTCAELVRRILTNELDFDIEDDEKAGCWLLRERLTGSVFRVVTRNPKLTNCFWNFYREDPYAGDS